MSDCTAVRPLLPEGVQRLEVRGLRVGAARADLRFERAGGGAVGVKVLGVEGELEVVPESAASAG